MKPARSAGPVARKATAKVAAGHAVAVKAKKAAAPAAVTKKVRASLRATSSARAELTSLLDSIHHNIDETEAFLAG